MNVSAEITTRGRLFSPLAAVTATHAAERAAGTLADEAAERIRSRLGSVLKNPTGRYESNIRSRRDGAVAEATDSGVIYGPWLEGVSSRNARSRFKGYATFRRVQESMKADASRVVSGDVKRLVKDLG